MQYEVEVETRENAKITVKTPTALNSTEAVNALSAELSQKFKKDVRVLRWEETVNGQDIARESEAPEDVEEDSRILHTESS